MTHPSECLFAFTLPQLTSSVHKTLLLFLDQKLCVYIDVHLFLEIKVLSEFNYGHNLHCSCLLSVFQDGKLLLTSAPWSEPLSALWSMDNVFGRKSVECTHTSLIWRSYL